MARYVKPSVLTLTAQDLLEVQGPAETQYCSIVTSNPAMGGNISPGDAVLFTTSSPVDPATLSGDDVSLTAELPPSITAEPKPLKWQVSVLGDTISVDIDHLAPGWYTLVIPAEGQECLCENGLPLEQFTLRFFNLSSTKTVFMLNNAGVCTQPSAEDDSILQIPLIIHLENPSVCPNEVRFDVDWDHANVLRAFAQKSVGFTAGDPPFDNPKITEYDTNHDGVDIKIRQKETMTPDCATLHPDGNYLVGYLNVEIMKPKQDTDICINPYGSGFDTLVGNNDWAGRVHPEAVVGTCYNEESGFSDCVNMKATHPVKVY
jgi:hypothetical protein